MRKAAEIIATAFYIGYAPIVPATFGAAFGALLFWLAVPQSIAAQLLVTIALIILAVIVSGRAEEKYGRDGRQIVIDEVAGMFVSLCFLFPAGSLKNPWVLLAAFVAFRVFDVLKPFPAGRSQRLPGGWGVVADDVVAGIYANILVRVLLMTGGT